MRKYKSRLCVQGGIHKQIVTGTMNTCSLVVQWSMIRMLITMTCISSLETKAIDFSCYFAPEYLTPPPLPVYIHCSPRGNLVHDTVLRINKIIYGEAEAPRLWFEKLAKRIEDIRFKLSSAYYYTFMSDKVICLMYVHDYLWFDNKSRILMR